MQDPLPILKAVTYLGKVMNSSDTRFLQFSGGVYSQVATVTYAVIYHPIHALADALYMQVGVYMQPTQTSTISQTCYMHTRYIHGSIRR